jgi:hypothetical protein
VGLTWVHQQLEAFFRNGESQDKEKRRKRESLIKENLCTEKYIIGFYIYLITLNAMYVKCLYICKYKTT